MAWVGAVQLDCSGDLRLRTPPWSCRWRFSQSRLSASPRAEFVVTSRSGGSRGFDPARFSPRYIVVNLCRSLPRPAPNCCASHQSPAAENIAPRARYDLCRIHRAARARFRCPGGYLALRSLLHRPAPAHGLGGLLRGRSRCVRGPGRAPEDRPRPSGSTRRPGEGCTTTIHCIPSHLIPALS